MLLINTLNVLLPVKYKTANAYSSGAEYRKSILLGLDSLFNLAIVSFFVTPSVSSSINTFLSIRLLTKASKVVLSFIIISMSPDVSAPLLKLPTISNFASSFIFTSSNISVKIF